MNLKLDRLPTLLTKTHVLFIAGITGLLFSVYKLFQEFNIEILAVTLGSLLALMGDHYLSNQSNEGDSPHGNLRSKSREQLLVLAKLEGTKDSIKTSKQELIKIIRDKHQAQVKTWTRFKWWALPGVFILGFIFSAAFPLQKNVAPSYDLAFYIKENDMLKIIEPDSVNVDVTQEDVDNNRVRLPLRLAIKNNESNTLKILKIVITHPEGYSVKSSSSPMIDPSSNSFVYEQDFATLTPTSYFTPLKIIDTLITPAEFFVTNRIANAPGGAPQYLRFLVAMAYGKKENFFDFKVDVYAEGRPVTHGRIRVKIRPSVAVLSDFPENSSMTPGADDRLLFQLGLPESDTLEDWETIGSLKEKIRYRLQQQGNGLYQFVYLDGLLWRINADTNSDGIMDYTLVNKNGDNEPDFRVNGDGNTRMYAWEKNYVLPPR